MAALIRESGAATVIMHGRIVAWRLPNGQVVCKKRRYRLEADAMMALADIRDHPMTQRIPWRHYLCLHCNGWHLSSHEQKTSINLAGAH